MVVVAVVVETLTTTLVLEIQLVMVVILVQLLHKQDRMELVEVGVDHIVEDILVKVVMVLLFYVMYSNLNN